MPDDLKPFGEATIKKNLRIWDAVRAVPAEFTKPFHPNGDESVTLTAVAPMFYFREATKQWGPFGMCWGFTAEHSEILSDAKGHPIFYYYRGENK